MTDEISQLVSVLSSPPLKYKSLCRSHSLCLFVFAPFYFPSAVRQLVLARRRLFHNCGLLARDSISCASNWAAPSGYPVLNRNTNYKAQLLCRINSQLGLIRIGSDS